MLSIKTILNLILINFSGGDELTIEDFDLRYYFLADRIHFQVSAKCEGWLMLGFNNEERIDGSYLVFGTIQNQFQVVEDHFVTAIGRHSSLHDLGEGASLRDCQFAKKNGKSTLEFSLPLESLSDYSPTFKANDQLYVWFAYSESFDLNHHSRKRIGTWINFKTNN